MKTDRNLPDGWEWKKLGDVCNVFNGKTPSKSEKKSHGYPILKIKDINENGDFIGAFDSFVDSAFFHKYKGKCITEGDSLFLNAAHNSEYVGSKSCYIKNYQENVIPTGEWLVIRSNSKDLYNKYKHFVLISNEIKTQMKAVVKGIHLYPKDVQSLKIPIPPIETQQRIVKFLDCIDEIRSLRKETLDISDQLVRSVFLEMFGDPVNNPNKWNIVRLNKICDIDKKQIQPMDIADNTKYVGLEHIESNSGEIYNFQNVQRGEIKSSKFAFTEEHILYGKLRPYLTKVAMPDFEGICSTDILPILPKPGLSNKQFLTTLLKHPYYVSLATERSNGANLPRISPKEINQFKVYLPPFHLQKQFADFVQSVEDMKFSQVKSAETTDEMFNLFLTKSLKGELFK